MCLLLELYKTFFFLMAFCSRLSERERDGKNEGRERERENFKKVLKISPTSDRVALFLVTLSPMSFTHFFLLCHCRRASKKKRSKTDVVFFSGRHKFVVFDIVTRSDKKMEEKEKFVSAILRPWGGSGRVER
jgi:hypothetical protein